MDQLKQCPFCTMSADRIIEGGDTCYVIRDGFPISRGHTLIVPKRHVSSFFVLNEMERSEIMTLLDVSKATLDKQFSPDGYNVGINDGQAAGQTVMHLHVHLIPRFNGDQEDPRGGVRWIFPDKAVYWNKP